MNDSLSFEAQQARQESQLENKPLWFALTTRLEAELTKIIALHNSISPTHPMKLTGQPTKFSLLISPVSDHVSSETLIKWIGYDNLVAERHSFATRSYPTEVGGGELQFKTGSISEIANELFCFALETSPVDGA